MEDLATVLFERCQELEKHYQNLRSLHELEHNQMLEVLARMERMETQGWTDRGIVDLMEFVRKCAYDNLAMA